MRIFHNQWCSPDIKKLYLGHSSPVLGFGALPPAVARSTWKLGVGVPTVAVVGTTVPASARILPAAVKSFALLRVLRQFIFPPRLTTAVRRRSEKAAVIN
jgi:hypothetical protein